MVNASASNIEWQAYAELDYGASHDLAAGLAEWALLKSHLTQYGLDRMATAVEVGCGGGRLTNAVARDFDVVNALDVAPHRIEQARKVPNARKVNFHLVSNPVIPLPDAVADFCISTHVFQHIADVRVTEAYLAEMFRVLRPGGCILVHIPVIGAHGMTGEWWEVTRRRVKEGIKEVVLAGTRLLMKSGLRRLPWKVDQYHVFNFPRLSAFLARVGYVDVELRLLPWDGGHSYILARKPARAGDPSLPR